MSSTPAHIPDRRPRLFDLALCSQGALGLITRPGPEEVTYADGTTAMAWRGIHVYDGEVNGRAVNAGDPWTSRNPQIVEFAPEELTQPLGT